ncbi:MAG TPA: 4'-phosphopantetheinyl transferase superfamily protein [Flavisolibacter sp.]|jgi:4'-phosphopantetheinyl transferase
MILIYHTSFDRPFDDAVFTAYLNELPTHITQKILRFRRWQDAHASLLGKLLLRQALKDSGLSCNLAELKYAANGRPYFENAPDFNISHAGDHVVCAFAARGRVGVDIERIRPIDIEAFRKVFHDEEWNHIQSSADPRAAFFYYWAAKESVIKADGGGLNIPLRKIRIKDGEARLEGMAWYHKEVFLVEDYLLQVASDERPEDIRLKKVVF